MEQAKTSFGAVAPAADQMRYLYYSTKYRSHTCVGSIPDGKGGTQRIAFTENSPNPPGQTTIKEPGDLVWSGPASEFKHLGTATTADVSRINASLNTQSPSPAAKQPLSIGDSVDAAYPNSSDKERDAIRAERAKFFGQGQERTPDRISDGVKTKLAEQQRFSEGKDNPAYAPARLLFLHAEGLDILNADELREVQELDVSKEKIWSLVKKWRDHEYSLDSLSLTGSNMMFQREFEEKVKRKIKVYAELAKIYAPTSATKDFRAISGNAEAETTEMLETLRALGESAKFKNKYRSMVPDISNLGIMEAGDSTGRINAARCDSVDTYPDFDSSSVRREIRAQAGEVRDLTETIARAEQRSAQRREEPQREQREGFERLMSEVFANSGESGLSGSYGGRSLPDYYEVGPLGSWRLNRAVNKINKSGGHIERIGPNRYRADASSGSRLRNRFR